MQNANHLLMIKPLHFGFNKETATNNFFQNNVAGNHQKKALQEFNAFVYLLRKNKVLVSVIDDNKDVVTPDAIFPNNWISFDEENGIFLYPMFAKSRRLERDEKIINQIKQLFPNQKITDLSLFEKENKFLEGTGSMVLDRVNKIAYACISPRTNIEVLNKFCDLVNYSSCIFTSTDKKSKEIYHTNVMMCIADKFVVICLDSIKNEEERNKVVTSFQQTNHEIIDISFEQMSHFAGNMLEVRNTDLEIFLVMSTQALSALNDEQLTKINKYDKILAPTISTIETIGGGGVRCMLAEIFLAEL